MPRFSITVLLTLLDDRYFLPEWVECVRRLAPEQVLVVDGGSQDGGPEFLLSQNLPNVCLVRHPMEEVDWHYGEQLNFAAPFATGDWILLLDADEVLWPADRRFLEQAVRARNRGALSLFFPRLHLWPDEQTRLDRGRSLDPQPRLWRRSAGIRWVRKVHQLQVLNGQFVLWMHPRAQLLGGPILLHRKLVAPYRVRLARHKRWLANWAEASAEAGFPIPKKMPSDHGSTVALPDEIARWRDDLMGRPSQPAKESRYAPLHA